MRDASPTSRLRCAWDSPCSQRRPSRQFARAKPDIRQLASVSIVAGEREIVFILRLLPEQGSLAAKEINFTVRGDPGAVRATVVQVLTSRGFTLTWQDDSTGIAVRGSRVANVLIGAFGQYFKVRVQVVAGQPGETLVRIERLSSGWGGGVVGVEKTRRNLEPLHAELEATFGEATGSLGVSDS